MFYAISTAFNYSLSDKVRVKLLYIGPLHKRHIKTKTFNDSPLAQTAEHMSPTNFKVMGSSPTLDKNVSFFSLFSSFLLRYSHVD